MRPGRVVGLAAVVLLSLVGLVLVLGAGVGWAHLDERDAGRWCTTATEQVAPGPPGARHHPMGSGHGFGPMCGPGPHPHHWPSPMTSTSRPR